MAIFVTLPTLVMLAAGVMMWRFPLDRKAQQELRRRIEERDGRHTPHEASDVLPRWQGSAARAAQVGPAGGIADQPAE